MQAWPHIFDVTMEFVGVRKGIRAICYDMGWLHLVTWQLLRGAEVNALSLQKED
jgi:hypothetical protein